MKKLTSLFLFVGLLVLAISGLASALSPAQIAAASAGITLLIFSAIRRGEKATP